MTRDEINRYIKRHKMIFWGGFIQAEKDKIVAEHKTEYERIHKNFLKATRKLKAKMIKSPKP